jgi:Zn-dependent protease
MESIFQIAVLIISVIAHEISHGLMAFRLGDKTAYYAGRLSVNPLRHIDLFGSIILPIALYISNAGFIFGWAKPVPFNPYNLRDQKYGELLVALAGPGANIFLALVFGLLIRFSLIPASAITIVATIVIINLVLAIFNLVPVPPLDGSKILFAFLPRKFLKFRESLERYGLILAIIFALFFWQFVSPIVEWAFRLIVGQV